MKQSDQKTFFDPEGEDLAPFVELHLSKAKRYFAKADELFASGFFQSALAFQKLAMDHQQLAIDHETALLLESNAGLFS